MGLRVARRRRSLLSPQSARVLVVLLGLNFTINRISPIKVSYDGPRSVRALGHLQGPIQRSRSRAYAVEG